MPDQDLHWAPWKIGGIVFMVIVIIVAIVLGLQLSKKPDHKLSAHTGNVVGPTGSGSGLIPGKIAGQKTATFNLIRFNRSHIDLPIIFHIELLMGTGESDERALSAVCDTGSNYLVVEAVHCDSCTEHGSARFPLEQVTATCPATVTDQVCKNNTPANFAYAGTDLKGQFVHAYVEGVQIFFGVAHWSQGGGQQSYICGMFHNGGHSFLGQILSKMDSTATAALTFDAPALKFTIGDYLKPGTVTSTPLLTDVLAVNGAQVLKGLNGTTFNWGKNYNMVKLDSVSITVKGEASQVVPATSKYLILDTGTSNALFPTEWTALMAPYFSKEATLTFKSGPVTLSMPTLPEAQVLKTSINTFMDENFLGTTCLVGLLALGQSHFTIDYDAALVHFYTV